MIEISPAVRINESEIQLDFVRASGPGGQNINKVATAVQLRFDVPASSLPEEIKTRLIQLSGKRVSNEGVLLIEARQFRTQEQNREAAIHRLVALIRKALVKPRVRKKTKPTSASREARLKSKKKRGETKKGRRIADFD